MGGAVKARMARRPTRSIPEEFISAYGARGPSVAEEECTFTTFDVTGGQVITGEGYYWCTAKHGPVDGPTEGRVATQRATMMDKLKCRLQSECRASPFCC